MQKFACIIIIIINNLIHVKYLVHLQHYYSLSYTVTKQKTIHWNGEGEETNIQLPSNGTAELWHLL